MTTPSVTERITAYLCGGGLFNPEYANHDAVRDLLIDAKSDLAARDAELAAMIDNVRFARERAEAAEERDTVSRDALDYLYGLTPERVAQLRAAELAAIEAEVRRMEARAASFAAILPETTAKATILAQIEALETQVREARGRSERLKAEAVASQRLREIGDADVRVMLNAMADDLPRLDRAHLKDFVRQVIETVQLDADSTACRIQYRIAAGGVELASPRVESANPSFRTGRVIRLKFRRLRDAA